MEIYMLKVELEEIRFMNFEKNLIYQSVRREDSIVITDPEREICTEQMQDYLMKHGYAIKIYNAESMRKTQDMISVDSLTKAKKQSGLSLPDNIIRISPCFVHLWEICINL